MTCASVCEFSRSFMLLASPIDYSSLFVKHDIGIRYVPFNRWRPTARFAAEGVGKDTFPLAPTESIRDVAVEYGNQV